MLITLGAAAVSIVVGLPRAVDVPSTTTHLLAGVAVLILGLLILLKERGTQPAAWFAAQPEAPSLEPHTPDPVQQPPAQ